MQVRQHVRNSLCEPPQVTSESQSHALLNMATGGLSSQGIIVYASHVWRATESGRCSRVQVFTQEHTRSGSLLID